MKTVVKIIVADEFDSYFDQIKNFCKEAVKDCKNLRTKQNIDYVNWKTNPACLMYKVYTKKDFLMLTLLYDKKHLVGLSGVEMYNKEVALIGRRLFILKKYRTHGFYFMLDPQVDFIRDYKFKLGIITINKYRKPLLNIVKRVLKSKPVSFVPHLYDYSGYIVMDDPIEFNGVEQYIVGIYTDKKYEKEKTLERWYDGLQSKG